ncbi:MAG: Cof-type HAD-IIB family hydrolase [Novosphingobium sp.]
MLMAGAPIRLLVSDIDGTLVRRDKSLPDQNVAAIRDAAARGLKISLISARPEAGMVEIAARLGLSGPMGAFNGGVIFSPGITAEAGAFVPAELAARLVALYAKAGVTLWLFHTDHWFTSRIDDPHTAREVLSSGLQPEPREDFSGLLGQAAKIVAVCDDPALMDRLEGEARTLVGQSATLVRSQDYYLDCTALAANKGDGVAALAKLYGVPLEQVAVIGDQGNDVAMFKVAGLAIAMGQARDAVKAEADEVTDSNEDAGVAAAIERFILPRI